MNLQEVVGAKVWYELRKQMDLIKPKKPKQPMLPRKKPEGKDVERATARLRGAIAKLKAKSPVKPVQMARPGKASS